MTRALPYAAVALLATGCQSETTAPAATNACVSNGCIPGKCEDQRAAAAVISAGPEGGGPRYRFQDLGALPNDRRAVAHGLNNDGVVVGLSFADNSLCGHPVRARPGETMEDLVGPRRHAASLARSLPTEGVKQTAPDDAVVREGEDHGCSTTTMINNAGTIVYEQGRLQGPYTVWRFSEQTGARPLPFPADAKDMRAGAINERGQVIINVPSKCNFIHACSTPYLYEEDLAYRKLEWLKGSVHDCTASAISASGDSIAGRCLMPGDARHAIWWHQAADDGKWMADDLNVCAGDGWVLSSVVQISTDGGTILGEGLLGARKRGFVFDDGGHTISDIGPAVIADEAFVQPKGINARGEIVGTFEDDNGTSRAFLISPERGLEYLDRLTDSPRDLSQAAAINDRGQIAGTVRVASGEDHIFLLTPL